MVNKDIQNCNGIEVEQEYSVKIAILYVYRWMRVIADDYNDGQMTCR